MNPIIKEGIGPRVLHWFQPFLALLSFKLRHSYVKLKQIKKQCNNYGTFWKIQIFLNNGRVGDNGRSARPVVERAFKKELANVRAPISGCAKGDRQTVDFAARHLVQVNFLNLKFDNY